MPDELDDQLDRALTGPRVLAWRELMRAEARVLARIREELQAVDLSISDFDALANIRPGEALRHTVLADRVILSRTGLTRLITRLCERGLLQRHEDAGDGRGVLIGLTDHGAQVRERAALANAHAVEEAMKRLGDDQVAQLEHHVRLLGRSGRRARD
ncbi:MAG: MarR family transcriptional regulator [Propionibacteriaceae bacterium]|nr:MarR family transcriptional regulator [Propionibacteriaceae bacterium]